MKYLPLNTQTRHSFLTKVIFTLITFVITSFMFVNFAKAETYPPFYSEMQLGSRGNDVRNLQIFLAANPTIYPEGLVTGYYGTLTKSAVMRFQERYGIAQVGRVGPVTLSKMTSLTTGGGWAGPAFNSVTKNVSSNSATLSWNTDENTTAKVFYGTSPVMMDEGDINSVGFGSRTGMTATNDGTARSSQQVTLSNLQSGTTYYYVIVATDTSGNVSVWNPNTTFKTN